MVAGPRASCRWGCSGGGQPYKPFIRFKVNHMVQGHCVIKVKVKSVFKSTHPTHGVKLATQFFIYSVRLRDSILDKKLYPSINLKLLLFSTDICVCWEKRRKGRSQNLDVINKTISVRRQFVRHGWILNAVLRKPLEWRCRQNLNHEGPKFDHHALLKRDAVNDDRWSLLGVGQIPMECLQARTQERHLSLMTT